MHVLLPAWPPVYKMVNGMLHVYAPTEETVAILYQ